MQPIIDKVKQHTVAIVAILGGIISGFAANHVTGPTRVVTYVGQPAKTTEATNVRADRFNWGELTQQEVNDLTLELKIVSASKTPVVIFCANDTRCGDMALNFENAFESAHWTVEQQAPLIDQTVGMSASTGVLVRAITNATRGRITPSLSDAPKRRLFGNCSIVSGKQQCPELPEDTATLVIGSKPR